jgi:hypothetical protein
MCGPSKQGSIVIYLVTPNKDPLGLPDEITACDRLAELVGVLGFVTEDPEHCRIAPATGTIMPMVQTMAIFAMKPIRSRTIPRMINSGSLQ